MNHSLYMQRALNLAELSRGHVSPNPMVGCVIVLKNKIIGEGWHQKHGQAHAEVNAINDVKDKNLLPQATVYVTLEPCSHFGKTPPCSDLLIKHRVKEVVICNVDPFPEVNGNGIKRLEAAGIKVITGILEEKGRHLNSRFFTSIEKKRPFIILKWAETADGFVADKLSKPIAISGELSQMHSHKWRTQEDAILVGSQTLINDNPMLTARQWKGRNPIIVVLDPNLSCNEKANIFKQTGKIFVFNTIKEKKEDNIEFIKIDRQQNIITFMLKALNERSVQSLIVEGGPRLHELFFKANIYDEVRVFKNKTMLLKTGTEGAYLPKNLLEIKTIDLLSDQLRIYSKTFQPF